MSELRRYTQSSSPGKDGSSYWWRSGHELRHYYFITVRGFGGAYYTPYSVPSRVGTLGIVCKVFLQHNEYNEDQCEKHYYGILSDLVMSWPDIRQHPFSMLIPSQIRIILPGRSTRHLLGIESTYLVPTPSSVAGWLRNDHAEVPRSWWMCR